MRSQAKMRRIRKSPGLQSRSSSTRAKPPIAAGLGGGPACAALLLFCCGDASTAGLGLEGAGAQALPASYSAAAPPEPPESEPLRVTTQAGVLRGQASAGVEQFLGIPYAAPPLGALRFAPPAPAPRWTGELDATRAGPACLQPLPASAGELTGSEDCLTLNVHRPAARPSDELLPVLLWLHGGSFHTGSGALYEPRRLVLAGDVLVVTINYRLGALGFLAHPELSAEAADRLSGDYGLLDQQAALRWVSDNIAAFGGDPQRVTLQGQSAGGASVCAQLASPEAAGLFTGAIIQSASCASVPLALAEGQGSLIASAAGCGEPGDIAACLRALPAARLVAAGAGAVFGAVVGGALLPRAPAAVVAQGAQLPVPVLVGGLRDEMRGFFAHEYPLSAADYLDRLSTYYPRRAPEQVAERYPLGAYAEPFDALSAALSDGGAYLSGSLGGCVTAALADLLSASTTTYAYELDDPGFIWAANLSLAPLPPGASHSSDLVYLFDGLELLLQAPLGPEQAELAEQMVGAWAAFIRSGAPGSTGSTPWPRYDAAERQMLLLQPGASRITTDFRERHHCDFWQTPPATPAEAGDGAPPEPTPSPMTPSAMPPLVPLDLADPALDPDLAFLAQDGFESLHFAVRCRSVGADGSSVEEGALPVGAGRTLQCETESLRRQATQLVLSSTNELFCVLGTMDSLGAGGDDRLEVSLVSTPEGAPWTLSGTRQGEPIGIERVVALGGSTWPLWVEAHYGITSIVPHPEGQLCDAVFGL